ncbi:methyltransferase [Candidatus Woesearchaeota archaeon]|nr:methyltransferase [Candidatus Woesearchaeota archaeon]
MTVYEPREDSFLLQKHVKKLARGHALDMGTGTGIQALSVYDKVKGVVALDINPEAVDLVRKSIEKGGIKNMLAYESDLFEGLEKNQDQIIETLRMKEMRFDTIIFNPPYLPSDEYEDEDTASYTSGGKQGHELLERFLENATKYLKQDGIILIVFSSMTDKAMVNRTLKKNHLIFEQLDNEKLFFEELYVYKIWCG